MKIFLDTDIGYGTDADDAVALAYLLRQPACELLGLTTVGRHSEWRADMADALCARLECRNIPIAAGADQPLYSNQYWRENPVRPWLGEGERKPRQSYEPNQALNLLRRTIREYPNEVTLITIGQLTNLGLLLLLDPETAGLLKAVVSMGGAVEYPEDRPVSECNVLLDPIAAGIVFQRLAVPLTVVPIEAVRGMPLEAAQLQQIFADERMDGVRQACRGWWATQGREHIGLADPLTVALVFEPELVNTTKGRISMRLLDHHPPDGETFADDTVAGVTAFAEQANGPVRLVRTCNKKKTHEHLMRILKVPD